MQGPHETIIRAGEERVLDWTPEIATGRYTVRARLIYDLNRYNDRAFKEDERKMTSATLELAADNEAVTVAYLPPRVYPNGTLNFEHVFTEPGNYVGIVTADGTHGEHWVARFLFSVAKQYSRRAPFYLLAAAAGLGLLLLFWRQGPPPSRFRHPRS